MIPEEDIINMFRITDRYRKALEIAQIYLEAGAPLTALDRIRTGLKVGDEVVTSGVFKLRNGAAVLVNNKITPANSPKPQPENS